MNHFSKVRPSLWDAYADTLAKKMNYETKYPINEELIVTSTRQTFFKVYLKKKWILISLFFVLSVCAFIPDDPDGTGKIVGGVLSGVTFVLPA